MPWRFAPCRCADPGRVVRLERWFEHPCHRRYSIRLFLSRIRVLPRPRRALPQHGCRQLHSQRGRPDRWTRRKRSPANWFPPTISMAWGFARSWGAHSFPEEDRNPWWKPGDRAQPRVLAAQIPWRSRRARAHHADQRDRVHGRRRRRPRIHQHRGQRSIFAILDTAFDAGPGGPAAPLGGRSHRPAVTDPGAPEAGRFPRPRGSRNHGIVPPVRPHVPGAGSHPRRHPAAPHADGQYRRHPLPSRGGRNHDAGWAGPAGGLRQHRQYAAGARRHAAEGNFRPPGLGRQPGPHDPSPARPKACCFLSAAGSPDCCSPSGARVCSKSSLPKCSRALPRPMPDSRWT